MEESTLRHPRVCTGFLVFWSVVIWSNLRKVGRTGRSMKARQLGQPSANVLLNVVLAETIHLFMLLMGDRQRLSRTKSS